MHILYNGQLMLEEELRLPLHNRAFQYNDGFFETVIIQNGKLRFWQDHISRMQEAAVALKLQLPDGLFQPHFVEDLLKLAQLNNAYSYGRLKLKVWRAGAGLYPPQSNDIDLLATVYAASPALDTPIHIGICQDVKTSFSPLSHFKGPNALLYVLAGAEKQERGLDDMVLVNRQGIVSELVSSNIFWLRDNVLYTPALDTGCVNGIMRRNILRWCGSRGIKVREVYYTPNMLQEADCVFAANVTGIRSISSVEGLVLPQQDKLLNILVDGLQELSI